MQIPSPRHSSSYPSGRARRLTRLLPFVVAAFFCLQMLLPGRSSAAGGELEAKVKAAYIFNFMKFVDWPADEGNAPSAPLRICLLGSDPVGRILEGLANRQVKGRTLKVISAREAAITSCHLLFISRSEQQRLPQIMQQLQGSAVLTVSDIPRFAERGGMIGFVTEGDRVKIEINPRSARQARLKLSAKLLEIARITP